MGPAKDEALQTEGVVLRRRVKREREGTERWFGETDQSEQQRGEFAGGGDGKDSGAAEMTQAWAATRKCMAMGAIQYQGGRAREGEIDLKEQLFEGSGAGRGLQKRGERAGRG